MWGRAAISFSGRERSSGIRRTQKSGSVVPSMTRVNWVAGSRISTAVANVRILRAVNQVRPVDQVLQVGSLETKVLAGGFGDELGAGAEVRPVEFLAAMVVPEMLGIRFGKKGALMMIKPPGQAVRAGIFEIDDHVLVRVEQPRIKQLSRAVHHAAIAKLRLGIDALPVEAREHCRRAGSVKTPIVKTN